MDGCCEHNIIRHENGATRKERWRTTEDDGKEPSIPKFNILLTAEEVSVMSIGKSFYKLY